MASLSLKTKKGNVIHRTTSESLRLGEDLYTARPQVQGNRKKAATSPSCSFQITGVLTRYDLEDESADDLDESHTDDISRVTDNETPSFSEDSRDTDDHQAHAQQNTGATSDQQCLLLSETVDVNNINVPCEDDEKSNNINNNGLGQLTVIKSDTVAPFCRGRWTCFDYLDDLSNISLGLDKIFGHEHLNTKTSSRTSVNNYLDIGNMIDQKIRPYWDSNCQQPYCYTGSILMPQPIPIYVPASSRPVHQKSKKLHNCPLSQNILPMMVKPGGRETDNFATTALNFHMLVNGNNKEKIKDASKIVDNQSKDVLEAENLTSGALELAISDIQSCENNNPGAPNRSAIALYENDARQSISIPQRSRFKLGCDEENLEAMATSHPRTAESQIKESQIATTPCANSEFPLVMSVLDFNETTFFDVYCFIRNFVGASVSCTATIDTKIEHALDVVKNHLTHAVRLEVEELKIKINELVERISYLKYENDLLRANVAPDVLATLGNNSEM